MNFSRRSHREDVLFLIALLIPAMFAGARFVESDRQMDRIARTQSAPTAIVLNASPVSADLILVAAR